MLKTPKYVATLFAFAGAILLAVATVSFAETSEGFKKLEESHQGVQKEATKQGDKSTPKRKPTHNHGTLETKNPNVGRLKAPEIRESGQGKLEGEEKKGEKSTPKRNATHESKPN